MSSTLVSLTYAAGALMYVVSDEFDIPFYDAYSTTIDMTGSNY